jgi:hypothetical protein
MPTIVHDVPSFTSESDALEHDIIVHVEDQLIVTLDALIDQMPQYSWSQIFQAVDTLARCGKVILRRKEFGYTLFSEHSVG